MTDRIDLNSDLGESFGPWRMGDDAAILKVVTSANIACGGHAGDPATMVETLTLAREGGIVAGAHPGFGSRGVWPPAHPHVAAEVEQMVATQIGALMGAAALAGTEVRYVKPHGALANWAADDRSAAEAIARATKAISPDLAILAISGTEMEPARPPAGCRLQRGLCRPRLLGERPAGAAQPDRRHDGGSRSRRRPADCVPG